MQPLARCLPAGVSLLWVAVATAEGPIGWRYDGTGAFPATAPPTRWSKDDGLLWSVPLAERSNGSPVRVGDRLFITAEPHSLLCFEASTGRLLWQHTHAYLETLKGAELAYAQAQAQRIEEATRAVEELRAAEYRLRRQVRKGGTPEQYQELARLNEEIARLRAHGGDDELLRPLVPLDFIGYSSSTPVSDGRHVYALFGNGVVAAYDLEGRRLWMRWVGTAERPMNGNDRGHAASPQLVDGLLIVPIGRLVALDARTGLTKWRSRARYPHFGTPVPVRAGATSYIVTPAGDVVRATDGEVVTEGKRPLAYASPVAMGSQLIFIGAVFRPDNPEGDPCRGWALRVAADGDTDRLWDVELAQERHYGSAAAAGGLIHAVNGAGLYQVLDAASGAILAERSLRKMGLPVRGIFYPSVALAGGYVFVSDDAGTTVVLTQSRNPEVVSVNALETAGNASLWIDDGRLFVRGADRLVCVGKKP